MIGNNPWWLEWFIFIKKQPIQILRNHKLSTNRTYNSAGPSNWVIIFWKKGYILITFYDFGYNFSYYILFIRCLVIYTEETWRYLRVEEIYCERGWKCPSHYERLLVFQAERWHCYIELIAMIDTVKDHICLFDKFYNRFPVFQCISMKAFQYGISHIMELWVF